MLGVVFLGIAGSGLALISWALHRYGWHCKDGHWGTRCGRDDEDYWARWCEGTADVGWCLYQLSTVLTGDQNSRAGVMYNCTAPTERGLG